MLRKAVGNGRVWLKVWLTAAAALVIWGLLTFAFWMDSVENLNAMTVVGLWIAVGACIQASLSMRKADPDDPL